MLVRRLVIVQVMLALLFTPAIPASTVHKTKKFGEPQPDKALVYVIREKAFVGGGVGIFVFADDQLIAFVRNNTYGFGYVEPGSHLIWGDTPSGLDVVFVAGETYYVAARPVNPITLMTEAEGKKAMESVGAYIESDQTDLDNAAKKIAKKYEKVQRREAKKEKAAVEELAVAAPPSATDGLSRLPANTKLQVELMQNLSSSLEKPGESVWFRVAADVAVDGRVLVPAGSRVKATVRQVKGGSSFGEQGSIEVALVSIDLDDATRVPLIGQLAAAGEDRAAGVMTGVLVGAFIKGTEVFHPAGSRFSAWTRDEMWLRPSDPPATARHEGQLTAPREIPFGANTRREPEPVEVTFPCSGDVTELEAVSVGDWRIPEPVRPMAVSREAGMCSARFGGWSLLRHITPGEIRPLHLHGRTAGQEMHVDIPLKLRVE